MRDGWVWGLVLLLGCAGSEDGATLCNGRACPRGTVCVVDQCRSPDMAQREDMRVIDAFQRPDRGMPDARVASDAQPDAVQDQMPPDAIIDAAVDAQPDGPVDMELVDCEPGMVRDCGVNVGLCRRGRQTCLPEGVWGDCEGGVPPRDEVCNGADDDCNGTVDDGFGVGEVCPGIGACGQGVIECRNTVLTRCSTEPGGTEDGSRDEMCNALDDDCDGRTDEGLGVGDACEGACGMGSQECTAAEELQCSTDPGGSEDIAEAETCSGRDDDCDGTVDEGFDVGGACEGVGACGAGVLECNAGAAVCSTNPGASADAAQPEACNGADDDCDGTVDEGFDVGGPCDGVGACGAGVTECTPQGGIRCSSDVDGSAPQTRVESCNSLDDDCDGTTDEGFDPSPEICNEIDDDCDDRIDEGDACGGDQCVTAPPFAIGSSRTGSTVDLANDYDRGTCIGQAPGRDQVFAVNFPGAGNYLVGVAPLDPGFDPLFWIGTDCENMSNCLTPSAGRNLNGPGRPEVRTIAIPRAGEFLLVIDASQDLAGGTFVASVREQDQGERCGTAIPMALPGQAVGSTQNRRNDVAGNACPAGANTTGNDAVYRLELAEDERVRVRVTPTADADPVVYLTADCNQNNAANCGGGVNAGGIGEAEVLEADLAAGTWFLVVDHVRAPGAYLIEVDRR